MDIALLTIRLVVGLAFAAHGSQKLFGAFGGEGIAGTADYFEKLGLRPGRLQAWAAGGTEFLGGCLIAVGLVTPIAAMALIAVMTVATVTVNLRNGFFVTSNGYEYNLVLVANFFALAAIGAGNWSLDSLIGIDLTGTVPALAALGAGVLGGLASVIAGRFVPDWLGRRGPSAPVAAEAAAQPSTNDFRVEDPMALDPLSPITH